MSEDFIVNMKPRSFWGAMSGLAGFVVTAAVAGALIASMAVPYIFVGKTVADQASDIITGLPSDLIIDPLMQKSNIYAKNADGTDMLMATFYDQNRDPVTAENVSPYVSDAIISTEDPRFLTHGGVDLMGIGRAVISNALGKELQGASSITQQYVKNVFVQKAENLTDEAQKKQAYEYATEESIARKLREARLAIALEKKYSKEEILLGYMNIVNFGGTTYGVEAASRYYFNVSAKDLTIAQAATLTAIVNNPSNLRIDKPNNEVNGAADGYESTMKRRNYVINAMLDKKAITQEEADLAKAEPITPIITNPTTGCASANGSAYFCDYVTRVIKTDPIFGDTPEERLNLLKRGGLQIYTTLDVGLQAAAENTMSTYAPSVVSGMDLGTASASVQPGTGRILSMAQNKKYPKNTETDTGPEFTTINYATDYTHGGSTGFQTGSTYKVFTLLEWVNKGHSISETVNGKRNYKSFTNSCTGGWRGDYTFRNYDLSNGGAVTPKVATQWSINTGFLEMAHQLDLCEVKNMAEKFGVKRADHNPLNMEPASTLGTNEIAPLQIATAFAGIAANGLVCQPVAIDKIVDSEGKDVPVPAANCTQQLDPGANAVAIAALKTVIQAGTGTGSRLNDGVPMFGKTGTTDNDIHAWMSGATSSVATSVWTGNVVGKANMLARTFKGVAGGQLRHKLFSGIMSYANQTYGGTEFAAPNPSLL